MMMQNPLPDLEEIRAAAAKIEIEPWMADFAKDRHTKEEWDGFFAYCEAGPLKRRLIRWASVFFRVMGAI